MMLKYRLEEAGWAELEFGTGEDSVRFTVSCLGPDPLATLMGAVFQISDFYQGKLPKQRLPGFNVSIEFYGEPSGLLVIFFPEQPPRVRVRVYHAEDVDIIPSGGMLHGPDKEKLFEGALEFDGFRARVYEEVSRTLCEAGLRGYFGTWGSNFPLGEFFRLHEQVTGTHSGKGGNLEQELVTLESVLRERACT